MGSCQHVGYAVFSVSLSVAQVHSSMVVDSMPVKISQRSSHVAEYRPVVSANVANAQKEQVSPHLGMQPSFYSHPSLQSSSGSPTETDSPEQSTGCIQTCSSMVN